MLFPARRSSSTLKLDGSLLRSAYTCSVDPALEQTAADRVLTSIANCLTPESARRLAGARFDEAIQALIEDWAERHSSGTLTATELSEYQTFVAVMDVISLLQAKACRMAKAASAA